MALDISNWVTQIRKGYIELCLLTMLDKHERLYGVEILKMMKENSLDVKEGTLYPLLNRLAKEGILDTEWVTEELKGHPKKYYTLTDKARDMHGSMKVTFSKMSSIFFKLDS